MTTVASTFTIWTNRASGSTQSGGLYTDGVGQNDNHQRRSNADSRWPGTRWRFEGLAYRSRLWTQLNGSQYDWLTAPLLTYTMQAAIGVFSLTSNAAGLLAARKVAADLASFTLTGTPAGLLRGYPMAAATGAFSLTGNAAAFALAHKITADAVAFTLTGVAAGLLRGYPMPAVAASFALSGPVTGLRFNRLLQATAGSFTVAGTAVGLFAGRTLVAGSTSFSLAAASAGLLWGRKFAAAIAAYSLAARDANLVHGLTGGSFTMPAATGTFSVSVAAVTFTHLVPPHGTRGHELAPHGRRPSDAGDARTGVESATRPVQTSARRSSTTISRRPKQ